MAAAKVNDIEPIKTVEAPVDPWSVMKTVYVLPEGYGETKTMYFSVNDREMWLKVGEPVEVPEPIAKRVHIYNRAIRARQKMYKELRDETAKNARFL